MRTIAKGNVVEKLYISGPYVGMRGKGHLNSTNSKLSYHFSL